MAESARLVVAIPLFDRMTALDAIGPYEVLQRLPGARVIFVGSKKGVVRTDNGMLGLSVDATYDEIQSPQVLVFPGGIGTRVLMHDTAVLEWVKKVHATSLFTTSVCTGSLVLAAAGLLEGLRATTHWMCRDMLAKLGAKPTNERVVREGKVITAAGVSSGIDMALQLALLLSDEATAKSLQLMIEYDPQPPFDAGSVEKAGEETVMMTVKLGMAEDSGELYKRVRESLSAD
eukprot:TRINITY_DN3437_c0_g1_i1.p1 TRINITY_DN3437_c0_g1~~TRINITY_DN3437_c0_g1_i1.p1  ORF type:complete len:232 (-),score=55.20 TRINITY_DN3437_c0_g1_i1:422-1117(-)